MATGEAAVAAGRAGLQANEDLHSLDRLQDKLPEHVCVAVEEDVPEVVHFTGPSGHVGKLNVVDEPHLKQQPSSGKGGGGGGGALVRLSELGARPLLPWC